MKQGAFFGVGEGAFRHCVEARFGVVDYSFQNSVRLLGGLPINELKGMAEFEVVERRNVGAFYEIAQHTTCLGGKYVPLFGKYFKKFILFLFCKHTRKGSKFLQKNQQFLGNCAKNKKLTALHAGGMKKIQIIKTFIASHKNQIAFADFINLYRVKMLQWIRDCIFDKKFLCDDEDIFQLIQTDLWKYNSFQNFKIMEDDVLFVNTFEKYLKNVIIKRAVANYFKKNWHRISLEYSLSEMGNDGEGELAVITHSVVYEAGEKFKSEENAKNVRELLEHAYKNTSQKGNAKRDIEMFILNKIDGYSVAELSVKFGVSANIVSTAIWRVGNKMKDILRDNF